MREAMIVCPTFGNDGSDLKGALDVVGQSLLRQFGGCTVSDAVGYWDSGNGTYVEPVKQFVVAYEESDNAKDLALSDIAQAYGAQAQQQAVYVRFADGEVSIIDTSASAIAAVVA